MIRILMCGCIMMMLPCNVLMAQSVETNDDGGEPTLNLEGVVFDFSPRFPDVKALSVPLFTNEYYRFLSESLKPQVTYQFKPDLILDSDMQWINNGCGYMGTGTWMRNITYKLSNGMQLNLSGEYDIYGNKQFNPSALPWQRNNFNAAFQIKSSNGKFGFRVEMHQY